MITRGTIISRVTVGRTVGRDELNYLANKIRNEFYFIYKNSKEFLFMRNKIVYTSSLSRERDCKIPCSQAAPLEVTVAIGKYDFTKRARDRGHT